MKTLLEYSYMSSDLTFEKIMKLNPYSIERLIYDKIVEKARDKIRKALKKDKTRLILRTIYLLKTQNLLTVVGEILGCLTVYKRSLWRLSLVHAASSFINSKKDFERIRDIIDTTDNYLPKNGAEIEKDEILTRIFQLKASEKKGDTDLNQYIEIYYAFGNFLIP